MRLPAKKAFRHRVVNIRLCLCVTAWLSCVTIILYTIILRPLTSNHKSHAVTVQNGRRDAALSWPERQRTPPDVEEPVGSSNRSNYTVLVWRWPFTKGARPLLGYECPRVPASPRCLLSQDARLVSSADAVVFHHRHVQKNLSNLPHGRRPPGQIWVWSCMEPPPYAHLPRGLHTVFNWTLTYRPDSDIPTPYGWLEPLGHPGPTEGDARVPPCGLPGLRPNGPAKATNRTAYTCSGKTELVAWAVSHSGAVSGRDAYHRELSRYLRVAVYGRGLNRTPLPPSSAASIFSRYLFYLAFENSNSRHYITEKLWANALAHGAVPVALGPPRADYERVLPATAFLHVDDFASPRELGLRMAALARDGEAYGRMHEWRARYRVRRSSGWAERVCAVCQGLMRRPEPGSDGGGSPGGERARGGDIAEWFEGD